MYRKYIPVSSTEWKIMRQYMVEADGQYTCLDCGATFDTPERYVERHGLECPPYEEYYGCPLCGGAYEYSANIESENRET